MSSSIPHTPTTPHTFSPRHALSPASPGSPLPILSSTHSLHFSPYQIVPGSAGYVEDGIAIPAQGQRAFAWNIIRGDEYIAFISNDKVIIYQTSNIQQILAFPYFDEEPMGTVLSVGTPTSANTNAPFSATSTASYASSAASSPAFGARQQTAAHSAAPLVPPPHGAKHHHCSFKGKVPQSYHKQPLKLISFCNDRIIAVSESYIFIFANVIPADDHSTKSVHTSQWELEQILEVSFSVECLSTNRFGDRIIVGGSHCQMFRFKTFSKGHKHWRSVWKEPMPNPVRFIQISPDDRLFATLSDASVPLVKIWYKSFSTVRHNQNYEHYSFLYLKHNKPILRMEWRTKEIMDVDMPNVLMTYSTDNVQRFWMETSLREDLHFFVCHAMHKQNVHSIHFLGTPHELSPNEVIMRHALSTRIDVGDAGHQDIFTQNETAASGATTPSLSETSLRHQHESLSWLMTIYRDGTVEIEMVCGLADLPRRTPIVTMWSHLPQAFDGEKQLMSVHNENFVYYSCSEQAVNAAHAYGAPTLITIYSQSTEGQLMNYSLNLTSREGSTAPPPKVPLHLNSILTGHHHAISKVVAHPRLPLAASYDPTSQQLILWHIRDSAYFSPQDILTHIYTLDNVKITDFAFLLKHPALFISTPEGIEILYIKSQKPKSYVCLPVQEADPVESLDLAQKTIFPPLPAYYSVQRMNVLEDTEEFASCSYLKVLPVHLDNADTDEEDSKRDSVDSPSDFGHANSVFLVALSKDKAELAVWKVSVSPASEDTIDLSSEDLVSSTQQLPTFTSKHIGQQILNHDVTCIDCESTLSLTVHGEEAATDHNASIVVAVGTEEGRVHLYKSKKKPQAPAGRRAGGLMARFASPTPTAQDDDALIFEEQLSFQAESSAIEKIRCCEFVSRITTCPAGARHVTVYESESKNAFTLEQRIGLENGQYVTQLEWYTFGDGQYILVVGTNENIRCFSEGKMDLQSNPDQFWEQMAILQRLKTHRPCTGIAITKERTILGAFGKNLHVYTKWLHNDEIDGIFEDHYLTRVRKKHRRLPDYHPRLLEDLLMAGDFELVRDVFIHLAYNLDQHCNKLANKESLEIYVPNLPVYCFKSKQEEREAAQKKPAAPAAPQKRTTLLDRFKSVSLSDSDDDDDDELRRPVPHPAAKDTTTTKDTPTYVQQETDMDFTDAFKILMEWVPKVRLPELSGIDQMNLMGIIDTFHKVQQKPEALDNAAVRFFVACTNAMYLQKSNKSVQIKSAHKAWMMQSETQESLVRMLNLQGSGKLTWNQVQQLGIPYWMNSTAQLQQMAQQMVRDRYAESNDPSACALIYLAMGKKSTLIQLYKTVGEDKIAKFLQRDFDPNAPPQSPEKSNCVLSARNAYKLIGQHKFEYAAAFFLLSGSVKDTIELLAKKVDILMAYFVLRLWKGDDHPDTIAFSHDYLIPYTRDVLRDPWLTSIVHWRCRDYEESLRVLCHERGSLQSFDASLYAYCDFISSKPQLARNTTFEECRKAVLLKVSHYFVRTGAIVLALETLQLFKALSNDRSAESSATTTTVQPSYLDPSESALMSGMVDMSAFGMGGMGGMMSGFGQPQMGGSTAKSSSPRKSDSTQESKDNLSDVKLSRLLKFKMSLLLMTQDLDDLSLKPAPTPDTDWNAFQTRIDAEVEHLTSTFKVDKKLLIIKLKEYSKGNGHLLSRCILSPHKNVASIMQSVVYHAVSLLSKMYQSKLSRAHIQMIHSFTREFVLCYERCESSRAELTMSQRADFGASLYCVLFIKAWSRNDFASLQYLLALPIQMSSTQNDSSNAFYNTLMFNLPKFYHTYVAKLKKIQEDEELERELAEHDSKNARKYYYGAKSPTPHNSLQRNRTSHAHSLSSLGTKSEQDAEVQQIKQSYYDNVFEAVLLSEFVENIKMLLHKGYAAESAVADVPYSIAARTIISSLTLWYSIVQDKLQYKQLEMYAATNQLPTRGFRDVATLSFARSHSPLSNLVKTLVFSARQSHKRRSTGAKSPRRKGKGLRRNPASITDFHSLVHAIPELKQGKESSSRANLIQLLDDVPLGDIVFAQQQQNVWDFLKSTVLANVETQDPTTPLSTQSVQDDSTAGASTSSPPFVFSEAIEIVKCKEPVKAFCIDRSHPHYLAYATNRLIREINIEHSIRYRRRNPSLDKLLDDEMPTWEQSLHRFDHQRISESPIGTSLTSHMSQRSAETMAGFMNPIDDLDEEQTPTPTICLQGMGSNPNPKPKNLWKRTAKKMKRASRIRQPSFAAGTTSTTMHQFRPSKQHSQSIDHRVSVSVMEAHPFLPFYLSGGYDGSLYLWQFQQDHPVRIYKQPGNPAITSIKFGQFGYKFGACTDKGLVLLWRFDSSKDSLQEFDRLHCHSDKTIDFTFLNSGSLIATIGTSNSVKELCVWDVLLPEHESIIAKEILEEEPSSITFATHYNYLIIGCKKGEILIYSVPDQHFVHKITVDDRHIETICMDTAEDFFVVGCSDGHCSVYDMNTFQQMHIFKHEHNKKGGLFHLGGDSSGVTRAEVVDEFLYSSGADGRIVRRSFQL